MAEADVNGRRYARLEDLKPGDVLVADGGFTCLRQGETCEVHANGDGELFVWCSGHGDFANRSRHKNRDQQHGLDGSDDGDGFLVGLYPTPVDGEAELQSWKVAASG